MPLYAEPQGAPKEASPVESWPGAARFGRPGRSAVGRLLGGGTTGNERLTSATGVLPGSRQSLLPVHKLSFIVWIAFTFLHVLAHLPDLPRALRVRVAITDELAEQTAPAGRAGLATPAAGRAGRALSLAGVLLAGVVLAVLYLPQFSARTHAQNFFGGH